MPSNRITLQQLKSTGKTLIPASDAIFGTPQPRDEDAPPPAIFLDFRYGAAAYECWGTGAEMRRTIHDKFVKEYQNIPVLPDDIDLDSSGGEDSFSERDDPTDHDYVPGRNCTHCSLTDSDHIDPVQSNSILSRGSKPDHIDPLQSNGILSRRSKPDRVIPRLSDKPRDSLIDAMDNMNAFIMYASGVTPEMRMAEWQKEEEERQLKNEEVSRSKVLEWMKDN
jgi:hypothetical protein